MASSQTRPTRQLRELLQEEQEASVLETYLSERAHTQTTSTPELSSDRVSKKPCCVRLQRIKKGFQYSSKILKTVYKKLVRSKKSSRIRNCNDRDVQETNIHAMEPVDDKEEAPSSSISLHEQDHPLSLSSSSPTRNYEETESATKDHEQNRGEEDSVLTASLLGLLVRSTTRVSGRVQVPGLRVEEVGVLAVEPEEEAPSNSLHEEDRSLSISPPSSSHSCEESESTTKDQQQNERDTEEDSILTASLLGLLVRSTTRTKPGRARASELQGFVHCKKMLMQNQQLMLDCVRELIDTFNGRRKNVFLGSEEIGELVLEKMKDWGKRSGDEEDMDMVLRDSSEDQWSDFRVQESEVVAAIGDEILEELENQFVMDMICGS